MKKLLALATLATLTLSAFGQGQVVFNNRVLTATPTVDAKIYIDAIGGALMNGTNSMDHAALLGGPTTGVPSSSAGIGTLSLLASPSTGNTWVTFRTGTLAGYLAVGTDSARDSGLAYSSTGIFQVVAWEGTETTWQAAFADWQAGLIKAGYSNPLTLPVSQSATDLNVPTLQGLNSFAITAVPEPATFALLGLGASALVIFRRRK